MNPIYIAYALAHGNTPEVQMEKDEAEYPGGCMTGFLLWVNARLAEFNVVHPEHCGMRGQIYNYREYYAWISPWKGGAA